MLCVTPQRFAEHLQVLRQRTRPLGLKELIQALQQGIEPELAAVVTFDDGYADNLHSARSLLERFDTPATVFVTSGYVGSQREFWWDEIERLLLQPGSLPGSFHVTIDGRSFEWELDEAAHYTEGAFERHRTWNVMEREDPGPRQRLYRSLCHLLRGFPPRVRGDVLDQIRTRIDPQPASRPTHRALSPEEVVRLADGGLVEVGAHTVMHPVLSAIQLPDQRAEILDSKARLEEILGQPVTSFAYPYGGRNDYTRETVAIIRDSAFTCACANFSGVVRRRTDVFQLPRILVRDWDGEEFARRLDEWFRG